MGKAKRGTHGGNEKWLQNWSG